MMLSRRSLLTLVAGLPLRRSDTSQSVRVPADSLERMREQLQNAVAGHNMALDLRALGESGDELFRIQINANRLMPVASCFKAFVVPWYYLHVPPEEQQDEPDSAMWDMAVHSGNYFTAVVLDHVASLVPGEDNALEKFNDFLLSIGMQNGLFAWDIGPTLGLFDLRFQPSEKNGRLVNVGEREFWIFNAFTASDLAQGYDFIACGEQYHTGARVTKALQKTRRILGIAERGFRSPIERVFAPGYIGKQGIILTSEIATGAVYNDAGVLDFGPRQYILAFMSTAEPPGKALKALREVVRQTSLMEQVLERVQKPVLRPPRVQG